MNRKAFIGQLWHKLIKPAFTLFAIYLCLKFLVILLKEPGSIKVLTILVLILVLLYCLSLFVKLFIGRILNDYYDSLPAKTKFYLCVLKKWFNYIATLSLGAVFIYGWSKDPIVTSIFFIIHIINQGNLIYKEELSSLNHAI